MKYEKDIAIMVHFGGVDFYKDTLKIVDMYIKDYNGYLRNAFFPAIERMEKKEVIAEVFRRIFIGLYLSSDDMFLSYAMEDRDPAKRFEDAVREANNVFRDDAFTVGTFEEIEEKYDEVFGEGPDYCECVVISFNNKTQEMEICG